MDKVINPIKNLKGTIQVPGDSAISIRAALLAAISNGTTEIRSFSTGMESQAVLSCLGQLGVEIERQDDKTIIHGKGIAGLNQPTEPIDIKMSIATGRMLCGILAVCNFETELVCDEIIANLPMRRVIEPLEQMGATLESNNFKFPLKIKGGPLKGIHYAMPVSSAQVKGTLLLAGILASGDTEIIERMPSRDHFERLAAYFGIRIKKSRVERKRKIKLNFPIDKSVTFRYNIKIMLKNISVRIT
jgi:3-phosphoshikimate 1-carboxyvinyltransferase